MSVVNADYTTVIGYIRGHIANGTQMSAYEMGRALAVIQDSISRATTGNTAQEAVRTSLATAITNLTALDATACAASAGATAAAIIVTEVSRITTAKASILTGELSVPTYVSSTVADGGLV